MGKTLTERRAEIRAEAQKIVDAAEAEARPLTDEEQAKFDELVTEGKRVNTAISEGRAAREALDELAGDDPEPDQPAADARPSGRRRAQTPGERVVNSEAYKAMLAAHPAGPPDRSKPEMGAVHVGGFMNAVTVSSPMEQELQVIAPTALTPIDIFDAINVVEGAPDSIKIWRATFTNNAAIQASLGDTKQESNLVYTDDTVNLDVIAHHTPIDKKTLWHNALLRNRIDVAMVNGVRAKAQVEVANELLASVSLMQQQGFDTDLATTLRKAMTKAMRGIASVGGSPVISVALSLEDHEKLDLELLDAMVALAGQELTPTGRIWRARVVPVFGLPEGVGYVGDLKGVDFYVGQGISVTTGWVNDQFIKNRLTILAEMEAKAAVINGAALVATDLDGDALPDLS